MKAKAKKAAKEGTFNEEFRDRYKIDKSVRTPSGGFSVSNGDDVAKSLNGLSLEQLEKIATRAGLADRLKKWAHLNPGMQRMNLGNVLRAATDKKKMAQVLAEARKLPRAGQPEKKAKATKTPTTTS